MNTRFDYLYRDAGNYKQYGSVVFHGRSSAALEARLKAALDSGEFFIAQQVGLASLAFADTGEYPANEDDHCWHEAAGLTHSDDAATDPRSIEDFVRAMEQASKKGWQIFAPMPDPLLGAYRRQLDEEGFTPFSEFKARRLGSKRP